MYVFVTPIPASTSIVSVSVEPVQVTVEPVKVVPFNLVVTVAPVSTVVTVSVSETLVEFVVYAYTFGANVGLKVSEPSANEARSPVKKPLWCPNPCTQQL